MNDFLLSKDLLVDMTFETNSDKYLRNIKETFEATTSEIKQISESAKDQAQSASDQVDHFKVVISNQEKQIDLSKEEIEYLKTANEVLTNQIAIAVTNFESSQNDAMVSKVKPPMQ
jgi:uncharacterized glyoxalase superfamily protein PhnB